MGQAWAGKRQTYLVITSHAALILCMTCNSIATASNLYRHHLPGVRVPSEEILNETIVERGISTKRTGGVEFNEKAVLPRECRRRYKFPPRFRQ